MKTNPDSNASAGMSIGDCADTHLAGYAVYSTGETSLLRGDARDERYWTLKLVGAAGGFPVGGGGGGGAPGVALANSVLLAYSG